MDRELGWRGHRGSTAREIREAARDYARVKDRMEHRFVHVDGSGYTWTSDRDRAKVVWLLRDGLLPDGRRGEAGKIYMIETDRRWQRYCRRAQRANRGSTTGL